MSISEKVLIELKKQLFVLSDKIVKDPVRLVVSGTFITVFGVILYKSSGLVPSAVYILVCLVNISKSLDNPGRPVAWGAGYFISELISIKLIPELKTSDFTSMPFVVLIFYIVLMLQSKAESLKKFDLNGRRR